MKNKPTYKQLEAQVAELNRRLAGLESIDGQAKRREGGQSDQISAQAPMNGGEAKYRYLFDNLQEGLWEIDRDAHTRFVNPRMAEMLGYTRAEMTGRHLFDFMDADNIQAARNRLNRRKAGIREQHEFAFVAKNGETVHTLIETTPLYDPQGDYAGALACVLDISGRKAAEKKLQRSEQSYRRLVENLNDIIYSVDTDGVITYISPPVASVFGYTPAELVGTRFADYIHPDDADFIQREFNHVLQDRLYPSEFRIQTKTGEYKWVRTSSRPIYTEGKVSGLQGVLTDITEKIKLEQELRQAHKIEALGALAGGIAHDFNNILSSIIGFTELAMDDAEKDPGLADNLREIYTAGRRAKNLVRQILAYTRQSDEKKQPIQPKKIAQEALGFIRSSIPATIDITHHLASESMIMGSATQLHQIFMNLFANAAHAMEDGGGVLRLNLTDIAVTGGELEQGTGLKKGDYVQIVVSDSGAGIAPELISFIFDPYFTTKAPGEGSGMGLAMVQGIVQSHGGKITVESTPGHGATFTVYLPVIPKRKSRRAYAPEQLPTGSERILFVDDEASIAKMGRRILERLGYRVTTRTDSIEALALFRAQPDLFDLVITDMTMPNLTGDKLAAEVMHIRPELPVILCTGYNKSVSEKTAADMGIKALAHKPIVKADLARTVRKVLGAGKDKST